MSYNITDIVSAVAKSTPLPATYLEADAQTRRKVEAEAERQGIKPEALWSAILAQTEEDAANGFDAVAIARAARR